jgi:hypothetical protein
MPKDSPKRLQKSLTGHYHELKAVFHRTAAHKLPSAMGALREHAVSRFVSTWIPKLYSVPTNVFATNRNGVEFAQELDLVIHDGSTGSLWPLDADGRNSIATWEEIRLVMQIKSTLAEKNFKEACETMAAIPEFANASDTPCPIKVLFAYSVQEEFLPFLLEKFTYSSSGTFPFDAFILLDHGAYFADPLRNLRIGIERGLSPKMVENDGPSQDRLIWEFVEDTRIPKGYQGVGDCSPESALLSLAALSTYATAGDAATRALLAASTHSEHVPIF